MQDSRLVDRTINASKEYAKAQEKENTDMESLDERMEKLTSNIEDIKGGKGGAGDNPMQGDSPYTQEEIETMIGKTITGYDPKLKTVSSSETLTYGTLSSEGYQPKKDYTGSSNDEPKFKNEDLGWKIWGIDDDNIYLISAKPTTTTLTLIGAQGYNNGVGVLNEICKTCYTDSDYDGVTVNSINAEDLKKVITAANENTKYDTTPYPYNFQYPKAYWNHDKDDELNNRHNQDAVIIGELETAQTHSPKSSYYYWTSATLGSTSSWTNKAYKDLYNSGEDYWLASRYVDPSDNTSNGSGPCYFGLQIVKSR